MRVFFFFFFFFFPQRKLFGQAYMPFGLAMCPRALPWLHVLAMATFALILAMCLFPLLLPRMGYHGLGSMHVGMLCPWQHAP